MGLLKILEILRWIDEISDLPTLAGVVVEVSASNRQAECNPHDHKQKQECMGLHNCLHFNKKGPGAVFN